MTGEDLRNAIRGKGLTIEDAAEKLGMSRQSLHYFLKKDKLSSDFLEKVKESLDIIGDAPLTLSELGALKLISENIIRTNAMLTVILSGLSAQPEFLASLRRKPSKDADEVLKLVNKIIRQSMGAGASQ